MKFLFNCSVQLKIFISVPPGLENVCIARVYNLSSTFVMCIICLLASKQVMTKAKQSRTELENIFRSNGKTPLPVSYDTK